MSKLADIFWLSQQVTVAASEECARLGHPQIDVEHLLLALLLTESNAGRRLRDLGIGIDQARVAVTRVHQERVASLGVDVPPALPGRMDSAAAGGIEWSPRALRLMKSLPTTSDSLPLLKALLDEPSGLTLQIIRTLGVDETAAHAAATKQHAPPTAGAARESAGVKERGWRSVRHDAFAPAPPAQVWALIADPVRRLEWDSLLVASVQPVGEGVVELMASTTAPDGLRVRTRPKQVRMCQTTVERGHQRIEWETTWPDVTHSPVLRLRIVLEPVAGGTRVRLTSRWRRRPGLGGFLRIPLLPLVKFGMTQQLVNRAAGISRAVR